MKLCVINATADGDATAGRDYVAIPPTLLTFTPGQVSQTVTVTVNAEPAGGQDFAIVDLPAITQAATVVHRGPMDDVLRTIQVLARWIDGNGYRSSGYPREFYLECPEDTAQWVTELQEPIAPAG